MIQIAFLIFDKFVRLSQDDIDRSCRRFGQCYKCLEDEHKDQSFNINGVTVCKGEEIGYRADLIENEDGERQILCLNQVLTFD